MTPNYDYDYGPTPDYLDYSEPDRGPEGFHLFFTILLLFVLCPVVVILNLILFIKIVRTKKISGEPWRWLIANTSLCMVFTGILAMNRSLSTLFFVPSLLTNPACYFFTYFETASWTMMLVTTTLIIIERFHGLRLGIESGGSFSKAQVILCLVPFWIIVILGTALPSIIASIIHGYSAFYIDDKGLCHIKYQALEVTQMFFWLWAFPTFIVVFIGTLVLKGRKTTTESMKQSIVTPTLALVCVSFVLMMFPITMYTIDFITGIIRYNLGIGVYYFLSLLSYLNDFAFPIIWLVTWSRIGDISLKCGKGDAGEHKRLLEEN